MPGAILYEGPSLIDHKPIFVAAIWSSKNSKTGDMLQTYIMRSDIDPRDANKSGEDRSICGDCRHRGTPTDDPQRKLAKDRTCYVTLGQGPLIVFNAYKAGRYPYATTHLARIEVGRGREVRIGTYGDGAAAPRYVWDGVLHWATGHTAYTHNGGDPQQYMISADSLEEAQHAWASKHRTFRIVRSVDEIDRKHEVLCPASAEAGHKATCQTCMLCGGTSVKAKSVAIVVHGSGATYF
jgi:hypothetical protein